MGVRHAAPNGTARSVPLQLRSLTTFPVLLAARGMPWLLRAFSVVIAPANARAFEIVGEQRGQGNDAQACGRCIDAIVGSWFLWAGLSRWWRALVWRCLRPARRAGHQIRGSCRISSTLAVSRMTVRPSARRRSYEFRVVNPKTGSFTDPATGVTFKLVVDEHARRVRRDRCRGRGCRDQGWREVGRLRLSRGWPTAACHLGQEPSCTTKGLDLLQRQPDELLLQPCRHDRG